MTGFKSIIGLKEKHSGLQELSLDSINTFLARSKTPSLPFENAVLIEKGIPVHSIEPIQYNNYTLIEAIS